VVVPQAEASNAITTNVFFITVSSCFEVIRADPVMFYRTRGTYISSPDR